MDLFIIISFYDLFLICFAHHRCDKFQVWKVDLFEINSPSPSVAVGNLITYYCILGYYGRERTYFNELLNLQS